MRQVVVISKIILSVQACPFFPIKKQNSVSKPTKNNNNLVYVTPCGVN